MDKSGTIHLLEGGQVWDVDRLANLYLKLTGRWPTPEERMRVRVRLEAANETGDAVESLRDSKAGLH